MFGALLAGRRRLFRDKDVHGFTDRCKVVVRSDDGFAFLNLSGILDVAFLASGVVCFCVGDFYLTEVERELFHRNVVASVVDLDVRALACHHHILEFILKFPQIDGHG